MKNAFDFNTAPRVAKVLGIGAHNVSVVKVQETTDRFADLSGAIKKDDDCRPWSDETPQLAVTFANANGVITERFSGLGYLKMADLSEEEIASGKYTALSSEFGDENYACIEKNGKYHRVISKEKTATSQGIISDLLASAGIEKGTNVSEGFASIIESKALLTVKVLQRDGKESFYVDRIMKLSAETVEAETDEL